MEIENEVTIATHNGSQVSRQHNLRNPKLSSVVDAETVEADITKAEKELRRAKAVLMLRSLVTEIQIFSEKTEDGRIVKSIKLCVPVVYENDKTPKISWDKLTPVESVVTLIR